MTGRTHGRTDQRRAEASEISCQRRAGLFRVIEHWSFAAQRNPFVDRVAVAAIRLLAQNHQMDAIYASQSMAADRRTKSGGSRGICVRDY
jgi:hypothetical protein